VVSYHKHTIIDPASPDHKKKIMVQDHEISKGKYYAGYSNGIFFFSFFKKEGKASPSEKIPYILNIISHSFFFFFD
jgi:hypothetical protein